MTATGTTSVMTTNIGGGNYVVDVNGIIPGLITQYDNGAQVLRVVPRFESFDFENQTLTGICLEFIWVSQLNTWISYNSGKYDDNRFTADNTVLIDTSQSGQLVSDILANGGTVNTPYVMGEFTGLRLSQVGQDIFGMIWREMERPVRN